ncbi:hypothetical protein GDO78_015449 [Eleutherodactylus coqui]|uniref:Uncharacterized protein n=1 Tax=Eleutherodactylus coqui TaxID=57060 RepID=A0A8J6EDL9_ELECQ|nr:hypothetical protein GDO78_015449 [Eleutherodactylus coqui]
MLPSNRWHCRGIVQFCAERFCTIWSRFGKWHPYDFAVESLHSQSFTSHVNTPIGVILQPCAHDLFHACELPGFCTSCI